VMRGNKHWSLEDEDLKHTLNQSLGC
jgi:hypothetical protein